MNAWADYWRYQIGVNVIPADTKNKKTWISWSPFQDNPIPPEQHDKWKRDNRFKDGMAIIPGKVWHNPDKKGLYLAFIDLDNQKAIDEFCTKGGKTTTLDRLCEYMIVEYHKDNSTKAHIYCYTTHPITKKSSDRVNDLSDKIDSNEIPAFEVKGLGEHGIAYCTPSPHKNGSNYEIIGTIEPETIDDIEGHIDVICKKYEIPYLDRNGNGKSLIPIEELFKPETKILEGHNRHEGILRLMESLIAHNRKIAPFDTIKKWARDENLRLCEPPLDKNEFEKQWNAALQFIEKKNQGKSATKLIFTTDETNDNEYQSNAEILVELAKDNTRQFFKDQYGMAFAVVKIIDHTEVISLESSRYKRYLSKLFYDNNDHKVIGSEAVNNTIQVLQAEAEYGVEKKFYNYQVLVSNNLKLQQNYRFQDLL